MPAERGPSGTGHDTPVPGSPSTAKERAEAVVNEARKLSLQLVAAHERNTRKPMLDRIDFALGATMNLRKAVDEYDAAVAADRIPDPAPLRHEVWCALNPCATAGWYVDKHPELCDCGAVSAAVSPAEPPEEEFRTLHRDFPDLIERLRGRAMLAKANGQGITAALHAESAAAIEELCAGLSEDRQLRWRLRARLDAALAEKEIPDA